MVGKITRIYNEKGLLSEVYQENMNGQKFLANKYTYNDNNWPIEENSRSNAKQDFTRNVYTYDEKGICKTIDSYYSEFKKQVLSVFLYDFYQ